MWTQEQLVLQGESVRNNKRLRGGGKRTYRTSRRTTLEDSSEDEEFYNQFQNTVQSTPVEKRTTKKANSGPTKTAKSVGMSKK